VQNDDLFFRTLKKMMTTRQTHFSRPIRGTLFGL